MGEKLFKELVYTNLGYRKMYDLPRLLKSSSNHFACVLIRDVAN